MRQVLLSRSDCGEGRTNKNKASIYIKKWYSFIGRDRGKDREKAGKEERALALNTRNCPLRSWMNIAKRVFARSPV